LSSATVTTRTEVAVAGLEQPFCLGGIGIVWEHHLRPHENILFECQRGDPGAEVGGNGNAFLDRSKGRLARLADKRQKDVLDGHRDSPLTAGLGSASSGRLILVKPGELRQPEQALTKVKDWPRSPPKG
jgi:hypothetical protein